jgi:serpin B
MIACSTAGGEASAQVADADVERETAPPTANRSQLVADNTAFAFDLYRQLAREQDGNLIFSPHSISLAFAMVYAGARDETAAQMAETLHYTLPQEDLHPAFNALDLALQPPEREQPTPTPAGYFGEIPADDLSLTIANALWGQEDFLPGSLSGNAGAGAGGLGWPISARTRKARQASAGGSGDGGAHQRHAPPDAITQARLALANAIYFRANGRTLYRGRPMTARSTWRTAQMTVPMMTNIAEMQCGRGDGYYAVELTYGRSQSAAMLILLPDEGRFPDFEDALDAKLFRDVLAGIEFTNMLTFTMPRFEFESEVDLREALSALGMTAPFGEDADFTGISSEAGLFIDYAGHKATISVDEQGIR